MSIGFCRLDASFCNLFLSRPFALSYTCTLLLPPHALTSRSASTTPIARSPFLSHPIANGDRLFINVSLSFSSTTPNKQENILVYHPILLVRFICQDVKYCPR